MLGVERITAIRARESAKNWIDEGSAVKGWYTCTKTGKKFRGENARYQFEVQERLIKEEEAKEEIIKRQTKRKASKEPTLEQVQAKYPHVKAIKTFDVQKLPVEHMAPKLVDRLKDSGAEHVRLYEIECSHCKSPRLIKPQDAFQVKKCTECAK